MIDVPCCYFLIQYSGQNSASATEEPQSASPGGPASPTLFLILRSAAFGLPEEGTSVQGSGAETANSRTEWDRQAAFASRHELLINNWIRLLSLLEVHTSLGVRFEWFKFSLFFFPLFPQTKLYSSGLSNENVVGAILSSQLFKKILQWFEMHNMQMTYYHMSSLITKGEKMQKCLYIHYLHRSLFVQSGISEPQFDWQESFPVWLTFPECS